MGQNLQGTAVGSMELFSVCFLGNGSVRCFCKGLGFSRHGSGRQMKQRNAAYRTSFFFFPLSSYLALPPSCRWQQPPPQRQRHLSPGLFLQSLFGSGVSSRTKAFPINNSRLRSLPLPLRHFILPSSIPGLQGRVVSGAQSRTWAYSSSS